jgi:hypothetical protein
MKIPVHQLAGEVLIDWHECKNCFCMVRPKKEYCCARCGKMAGLHNPIRHYHAKEYTDESCLYPKIPAILSTPFFAEEPIKVLKEEIDKVKADPNYTKYSEPDPKKLKELYGLKVYEA